MKYDKLRGSSIAEMMMQLRSQYGQSVYILQTKEIRQGGLFGSDLLSKKQYEIEYMVSEGDAPYGKAKARLPERSPDSALRRSVEGSRSRSLAQMSSEQQKRPALKVNPPEPGRTPSDRSLPDATVARPFLSSEQKHREPGEASAIRSGSRATDLNDLDALIEQLKALKHRPSSEANQTVTELARRDASQEILADPIAAAMVVVPAAAERREIQPQGTFAEEAINEMPTREELEALFRYDAGPDQPEASTSALHTGGEKDTLSRIRQRLLDNQASTGFVDRFMGRLERSLSAEDRMHPNRVRNRSIEKLKEMIRLSPSIEREHGQRKIVFFVGPNGSGKTTSLTKLAARYRIHEGAAVSIFSLDMHRIAATEQLKWAALTLEVPFFAPISPSEFRELVDRDGSDYVFVDTSGMGLRDADRRDTLLRFIECAGESVEVHLVLPVSIAPSLTEKYMDFFESTGFEKILLTRLDETDFLANFIEVADKWKRPFSFLNDSPDVPGQMMMAGAEDLARMVLGFNG